LYEEGSGRESTDGYNSVSGTAGRRLSASAASCSNRVWVFSFSDSARHARRGAGNPVANHSARSGVADEAARRTAHAKSPAM